MKKDFKGRIEKEREKEKEETNKKTKVVNLKDLD